MSSLRDKRFSKTEGSDARIVAKPADVTIGRVVSVTKHGAPVVEFPGCPGGRPMTAQATAPFDLVPPGSVVALMFLGGDKARPLALGVISEPEPGAEVAQPEPAEPQPEETLTLTAKREIVLRCGRASLVLTRAGKVLVRGAYVSLRSSGMQRIIGASVQIN
jgi:Domain of unknown function (DUF6484)